MHRTPNTIIRGCVLVPNAIRSMGSFIDGFQDMEIRVSIKFSLIHVLLIIRVQEYLVKNFILFVAYFKQKPQCI